MKHIIIEVYMKDGKIYRVPYNEESAFVTGDFKETTLHKMPVLNDDNSLTRCIITPGSSISYIICTQAEYKPNE